MLPSSDPNFPWNRKKSNRTGSSLCSRAPHLCGLKAILASSLPVHFGSGFLSHINSVAIATAGGKCTRRLGRPFSCRLVLSSPGHAPCICYCCCRKQVPRLLSVVMFPETSEWRASMLGPLADVITLLPRQASFSDSHVSWGCFVFYHVSSEAAKNRYIHL